VSGRCFRHGKRSTLIEFLGWEAETFIRRAFGQPPSGNLI
jgi:hypothetical protein